MCCQPRLQRPEASSWAKREFHAPCASKRSSPVTRFPSVQTISRPLPIHDVIVAFGGHVARISRHSGMINFDSKPDDTLRSKPWTPAFLPGVNIKPGVAAKLEKQDESGYSFWFAAVRGNVFRPNRNLKPNRRQGSPPPSGSRFLIAESIQESKPCCFP